MSAIAAADGSDQNSTSLFEAQGWIDGTHEGSDITGTDEGLVGSVPLQNPPGNVVSFKYPLYSGLAVTTDPYLGSMFSQMVTLPQELLERTRMVAVVVGECEGWKKATGADLELQGRNPYISDDQTKSPVGWLRVCIMADSVPIVEQCCTMVKSFLEQRWVQILAVSPTGAGRALDVSRTEVGPPATHQISSMANDVLEIFSSLNEKLSNMALIGSGLTREDPGENTLLLTRRFLHRLVDSLNYGRLLILASLDLSSAFRASMGLPRPPAYVWSLDRATKSNWDGARNALGVVETLHKKKSESRKRRISSSSNPSTLLHRATTQEDDVLIMAQSLASMFDSHVCAIMKCKPAREKIMRALVRFKSIGDTVEPQLSSSGAVFYAQRTSTDDSSEDVHFVGERRRGRSSRWEESQSETGFKGVSTDEGTHSGCAVADASIQAANRMIQLISGL